MKATTALSALLALGIAGGVTAASETRATFTSLGKLRIGMTPQAVEAALGGKLISDFPGTDSDECQSLSPAGGDGSIGFMMLDGRLARIDISDPAIPTLSGAHVGSSKAEVLALYGSRVTVSPHAYTAPDGEYLTLLSPDRKHGIRFETDHDKVVLYYLGTADAIEFIEGCL